MVNLLRRLGYPDRYAASDMKLRLIDCFWLTGFAASCLSAVSNIHIPAIAFTALLLLSIQSGDSIQQNGRSLKHCLPLLIGPIAAITIWFLDLIQVAVPIGILCLIYGTYRAVIDQNNKQHNPVFAAISIAWGALLVDGTLDIYNTPSMVAQTILAVIGLFSAACIYSWRFPKLATCISIFWTIQTGLVWQNATEFHYGIGWLHSWR